MRSVAGRRWGGALALAVAGAALAHGACKDDAFISAATSPDAGEDGSVPTSDAGDAASVTVGSGSLAWARVFGDGATGANARMGGVTADPAGNVYFTGSFDLAIDLSGERLISAGKSDAFLAGLGPDGRHVFSRRFGDGEDQYGMAVAASAGGDVYWAALFAGTILIEGSAAHRAAGLDSLLARFDRRGQATGSLQVGGADLDFLRGVAAGASQGVVVAGDFADQVTVRGNNHAVDGGGRRDGLVASHFTLNGAGDGVRVFGGRGEEIVQAVAVDRLGNVYVGGRYAQTLVLDGLDALVATDASAEAFVVKLDSTRRPVWARSFGGGGNQEVMKIAASPTGGIVVGGVFSASIDLRDGVAHPPKGGDDLFVVHLLDDGATAWGRTYGGPGKDALAGLVVGREGRITVVGSFEGVADLGGGELVSAGESDFFVAALSLDGTHLASRRYGGPLGQSAAGAALDLQGNLILAGNLEGPFELEGTTLTPRAPGSRSIFVAKLAR